MHPSQKVLLWLVFSEVRASASPQGLGFDPLSRAHDLGCEFAPHPLSGRLWDGLMDVSFLFGIAKVELY